MALSDLRNLYPPGAPIGDALAELECLRARVVELEAALTRIGTDRALSRAECAVIAAEAIETIEL